MKASTSSVPMRFQERDGQIIHTIQEYGGVMAKRQLHDQFWMGKSKRAMQVRLSKLSGNEFISWPSLDQRKTNPIPESIVWLDWKGALYLADQSNLKVIPPKNRNENQLRSFEQALRSKGFRWLREPRWSQLKHDLTGIDLRMKFEFDIQTINHLGIEKWINETDFRSDYDRIVFSYKDKQGQTRQKKRGIIPDSYFCFEDQTRKAQGLPAKAHFLLEIDMATHDNTSFGIEKAAAGGAYIQSSEYGQRFGSNSGRWLIITTSDLRLKNLMRQTKEKAGKNSALFFFSTFSEVFTNNVFLKPIWSVTENDQKQILLPEKE